MDKRDRVFVIFADGSSTLDCIADSFPTKGHVTPGAGLIWGLLLAFFLSLLLGVVLSVSL